MAGILKLNAISPLADPIFAGYEYGDNIKDPMGIMVRSANMADYPAGENLLAVARAGAGTNNIPVAEYAKKGIVVFNTPGANANAVKELVICELFLGGRKITEAIDWVKSLKGEGENVGKLVEKGKGKFAGHEIYGKTLGVIGLGAIGIMVANAAKALGMRVLGADPFLSTHNALMLDPAVEVVAGNDEIYRRADFITVHVPLTPQTKGMLNRQTLDACRDGVVIINNSRGELADTAAVKEALESGKLSRYITDFPTADLIGVDGAICLPHLGASTPEAEDNCAVMAANQLKDYIENGNITNSVNYPAVSAAREGTARICICHMNRANMIAQFAAAISAKGINIANMTDKAKGDYAYGIIDIENEADDGLVRELEEIEGVIRVRVV
ncbi:MAG TPA: phosphoglycerate dehydrogenase [Candidatus Coproplasma excrementipullorum]|nr:phosphoglycerate dehydrogenase [Candidatus Coproplasma excrementipullorum]